MITSSTDSSPSASICAMRLSMCRHLRVTRGVEPATEIVKDREVGSQRDVGQAHPPVDQVLALQRGFEIIELRRQVLAQQAIDHRGVRRDLVHDRSEHSLLEQPDHVRRDLRIDVLLEPQDARVLRRVVGSERMLGEALLEVSDDDRGVREREVAVLQRRDLARRAELAPTGRRIEREHGFYAVLEALLQRGDDHLANVNGQRDAIDREHGSAP